jgi:hydroxymethylglutaryl-CoA reductase (NADPH)
MSASSDKVKRALYKLANFKELIEEIRRKPDSVPPTGESFPARGEIDADYQSGLLNLLKSKTQSTVEFLSGNKKFDAFDQLTGSIENYIGMTMVPTGVIGPVSVLGTAARGEYYVPLATTEGALVASYHRGAKAARLSGGITSVCLTEGVQRCPLFRFNNVGEVAEFLFWVLQRIETFKVITSGSSRYAKLQEMRPNIEGNHLIIVFEFYTGDAAGQNMVTLCTDAICQYIIEHCPVKPVSWLIESNYSGDKKASAVSFTNVRGKKVTAEVIIPEAIVKEVLKSTPAKMAQLWQSSTIGMMQSGAVGTQGHIANGLAALFLACGQDVACVAEASVGISRMEVTDEGKLYACVTLPGLIVGSVGGGTSLPTQRECLEMIGCYGPGNARKFAEICGAVVLSGELSIAAALSAGHFVAAHKNLGRKKKQDDAS